MSNKPYMQVVDIDRLSFTEVMVSQMRHVHSHFGHVPFCDCLRWWDSTPEKFRQIETDLARACENKWIPADDALAIRAYFFGERKRFLSSELKILGTFLVIRERIALAGVRIRDTETPEDAADVVRDTLHNGEHSLDEDLYEGFITNELGVIVETDQHFGKPRPHDFHRRGLP